MKHYVLILVTLALAALLAGCDTGTAASAGTADEKRKVTVSPEKDPRLILGDEATTADNGTTLAVLSYESPTTVKGAKPEKGLEFSGVEVKGCAGPDSENSLMHIGPDAFVLRMPSGVSILPESGARAKEPALESMNPLAGECDRGFVTFQTPEDKRPELVLYEEQFVLENTLAWKVSEKR